MVRKIYGQNKRPDFYDPQLGRTKHWEDSSMKLISTSRPNLRLQHAKNIELNDQYFSEQNDPLFQNQGPWVYLSVQVRSETQLIEAKNSFGLQYKMSSRPGIYHYFVMSPNLTHKEKNIQLFAAGLYLLSKQDQISIFLGSMDVLAFRIRHSDLLCSKSDEPEQRKSLSILEDSAEEFQKWIPKANEFQVSETALEYLKFAQVTLENSSITKGKVLNEFLKNCFDQNSNSPLHSEKNLTSGEPISDALNLTTYKKFGT